MKQENIGNKNRQVKQIKSDRIKKRQKRLKSIKKSLPKHKHDGIKRTAHKKNGAKNKDHRQWPTK